MRTFSPVYVLLCFMTTCLRCWYAKWYNTISGKISNWSGSTHSMLSDVFGLWWREVFRHFHSYRKCTGSIWIMDTSIFQIHSGGPVSGLEGSNLSPYLTLMCERISCAWCNWLLSWLLKVVSDGVLWYWCIPTTSSYHWAWLHLQWGAVVVAFSHCTVFCLHRTSYNL